MLTPTHSDRLKYRRYHKYMRRRRQHPMSMQDFVLRQRPEAEEKTEPEQTQNQQSSTKKKVVKKKKAS